VPNERERNWVLGLAALCALGLLAGWLRPTEKPPELADRGFLAPAPLAVVSPHPLQSEGKTTAVNFVDGVPVRPAGSAALDATGMLPHPLTAQHARIFRENNIISNLNGAMDVKDAAGMRRLLAQYRDEFPEDGHVLQDGYELIADCLAHPSAELRAKAQRYYDEELDSGVRRYIRRHCLEPE